MLNLEQKTVDGFGAEWAHFDQSEVASDELCTVFDQYFAIFPWQKLNPTASVGADFGCGSGRWARIVAQRVAQLTLVDASPEALLVAQRNLASCSNVSFLQATIDDAKIARESLDFAFSLGVLHHVPDTQKALNSIALTLKPGSPFLVYLYYAFDNRPFWFRQLWRVSDWLRRCLCQLPFGLRRRSTDVIAAFIYWPLARVAKVLAQVGLLARNFPLAYYRDRSFYIMRNDALDRFGTRLEQRFTRQQIHDMLAEAGFGNIRFSENEPFWCAVAEKRLSQT